MDSLEVNKTGCTFFHTFLLVDPISFFRTI